MQIQVGNRTLELKFGYETREGVQFTKCLVIQPKVKEDGTDLLVACASVKKHPKQNHYRFIARRHALARAIHLMDRTERTEIWKAYLAVVRMPKS